jgi:hypothetical protein
VGTFLSVFLPLGIDESARILAVPTSFCPRHRYYWLKSSLLTAGLLVGSVFLPLAGCIVLMMQGDKLGWDYSVLEAFILSWFALVVAGIVLAAIIRHRTIRATKITEDTITLTGVCRDYVEAVRKHRAKKRIREFNWPMSQLESDKQAVSRRALAAGVLGTSFLGLLGLGGLAGGWYTIQHAQETPDVKLVSPKQLSIIDMSVEANRRLRTQFVKDEGLLKLLAQKEEKMIAERKKTIAELAATERRKRVVRGYVWLAGGALVTILFICDLFVPAKKYLFKGHR